MGTHNLHPSDTGIASSSSGVPERQAAAAEPDVVTHSVWHSVEGDTKTEASSRVSVWQETCLPGQGQGQGQGNDGTRFTVPVEKESTVVVAPGHPKSAPTIRRTKSHVEAWGTRVPREHCELWTELGVNRMPYYSETSILPRQATVVYQLAGSLPPAPALPLLRLGPPPEGKLALSSQANRSAALFIN